MGEYFKLVYELVGLIACNIYDFFKAVFVALNNLLIKAWADYFYILQSYTVNFNVIQWFFTIILCALILALPVGTIVLIVFRIRHRLSVRRQYIDQREMLDEIDMLNKQVCDLVDEKNKILAMKVSQLGLKPGELEQMNLSKQDEKEPVRETAVRFPKLNVIDLKYESWQEPEFNDSITLKEFVEGYRNFAASRLKLYYDTEVISLFVAGMASTKILILEGISGTGKTSLPYSMAQYISNPATLVSVQPSFRDRTELIGYFNEFSKKFNETEFLRALYEANYRREPNYIVLDEMNLARIEYYFAEMLSVLEMPTPEEWIIDLVPTAWENDPKYIRNGKITVSTGIWFVGTANNDDSTFTITDKVYDRSIPIELNERCKPFEAPDTGPVHITSEHLERLFDEAVSEYGISEGMRAKLEKLDIYLQTRFKLAFGNRIMKQIEFFVPVFVACGGTEMRALDYFIARKILKKFESMNISYVRDEIKELVVFLEKTFGKNSFTESKRYLQRIQNLF